MDDEPKTKFVKKKVWIWKTMKKPTR